MITEVGEHVLSGACNVGVVGGQIGVGGTLVGGQGIVGCAALGRHGVGQAGAGVTAGAGVAGAVIVAGGATDTAAPPTPKSISAMPP